MKCKITGDKLSPFMSFGKMPSANGFLYENNFDNEFFYEMEVGFSNKVSSIGSEPIYSFLFCENTNNPIIKIITIIKNNVSINLVIYYK